MLSLTLKKLYIVLDITINFKMYFIGYFIGSTYNNLKIFHCD